MWVHHGITPSIKFAGSHLYIWVERSTESKASFRRTQHNGPSQGSNSDHSTRRWHTHRESTTPPHIFDKMCINYCTPDNMWTLHNQQLCLFPSVIFRDLIFDPFRLFPFFFQSSLAFATSVIYSSQIYSHKLVFERQSSCVIERHSNKNIGRKFGFCFVK